MQRRIAVDGRIGGVRSWMIILTVLLGLNAYFLREYIRGLNLLPARNNLLLVTANLESANLFSVTADDGEREIEEVAVIPNDSQEELGFGTEENVEKSDLYVEIEEKEWNELVDESVRDSPRLIFDVHFHVLTDSYGLIDWKFSEEDLLEMAKRVIRTWAQANIFIRFRKSDFYKKESIGEERSEAYKIYVTGSKSKTSPILQSERQELTKKIGKERSQFLYYNFLHYLTTKCCVIEKYIVGSDSRTKWQKQNMLHVYTMYYLRWYNAFQLDRMTVIRGGSCWGESPQELKEINGKPVRCKLGYYDGNGPQTRGNRSDALGAREWEQFPFTLKHVARTLAHEIGHYFGMDHYRGEGCRTYKSIREMNLMNQQKYVTITGIPCSMKNNISVEALHLRKEQIRSARRALKRLDIRETPTVKARRVGPSLSVLAQNSAIRIQHGLLIMSHLPSPCDGTIRKYRLKLADHLRKAGKIVLVRMRMDNDRVNKFDWASKAEHLISPQGLLKYRHLEVPLSMKIQIGDIFGIGFLDSSYEHIQIMEMATLRQNGTVWMHRQVLAPSSVSALVTTQNTSSSLFSQDSLRYGNTIKDGELPMFNYDIVCT